MLSASVLFTARWKYPSCQSTNKTKSGMLGADFIPSTSPPCRPSHSTPPHPPSPKNPKRWHCGAPLVCSWWPVRSIWCEWAGVEAGAWIVTCSDISHPRPSGQGKDSHDNDWWLLFIYRSRREEPGDSGQTAGPGFDGVQQGGYIAQGFSCGLVKKTFGTFWIPL